MSDLIISIYIITPCSRKQNLSTVLKSIDMSLVEKWIIVYDRPDMTSYAPLFHDQPKIVEIPCQNPGVSGNACRNMGLDYLKDNKMEGMVFFLDDDNLVHPKMWDLVKGGMKPDHVYTFDQQRDRNPYNVLPGSNPIVCSIDTAMMIAPISRMHGSGQDSQIRWRLPDYAADGFFIEAVVNANRQKWIYVPTVMSYWNRMHYSHEP